MVCIKCKRKLEKGEHCYVLELVEVIGYEIYKQINHKAAICKGCWRGEGGGEMPTLTTYIYIRGDGKCVHSNAGYGWIGQEYEHDDPNWQPPKDWPYEIIDMRKDDPNQRRRRNDS